MATTRGTASGDFLRCSEFLEKVQAAPPAPIYVLTGSDPYLMAQARDAIRNRVLEGADPGLAILEVEGPSAVLADVLDALRTPAFLSPRRLVIIRDADEFLPAAREALQHYLEAPASTGTLCLEVASWNPKTKLGGLAARTGFVVRCEADMPDRLPRWLQGHARKTCGKTLTYRAAEALVEYLGANLGDLVGAVERLDLFTNERTTIDEPDVDAVVAHGLHERAWALCNAVTDRRLPRALELLNAFWAEGMTAPQVVGLLRREIRQLVLVNALGRRMGLDQAIRQAQVHPAAAARIRRALQAFSDDHLAAAYQALVDADLAAKTTSNDRLAMETLLHRLCLPSQTAAKPGQAT